MFEFSDVKKTRFYRDVAQESGLKEKRKIARTMLKKNFSVELIAEITGLPQKEIRPLTKNVVGRQKRKPVTKLDFAADSK